MGFAGVMSGPLVRSSYRAGRLYKQAVLARGGDPPNPPLRSAPRCGNSPIHRPLTGPEARFAGPV